MHHFPPMSQIQKDSKITSEELVCHKPFSISKTFDLTFHFGYVKRILHQLGHSTKITLKSQGANEEPFHFYSANRINRQQS